MIFNKLKRGQGGAVMAEFAILIPFLLLLLAGIAEIGFTYYHLDVLNKSVQDAARWFSDYSHARNNVYSDNIDTSTASNATNITSTQNLVKFGNISSSGLSALLPPNDGSNYTSINIYCAEENTTNTQCASTTKHIRVTATYNHTYMLGNLLRSLCGNCIPATNYPLKASAVFRVQGGS